MRIPFRAVRESIRAFQPAADPHRIQAPPMDRWKDLVVARILVGMRRILRSDHLLVKLLPRPYADEFLASARRHGARDVHDLHRRALLDINLTSHEVLEGMPDELHALLHRYHEPRHLRMRDGQHA